MILFTRAVARDFRVLCSRCVSGRPRGPAPAVVVEVEDGIRRVWSTSADGVILTHTSPAPGESDDLLVLPGTVLAEAEGGTDESVTLDRHTKLRGTVRCHDGAKPRSLPVELILPGRQHELPSVPPLSPTPANLLLALHECGRSAARESGRYALSRIQLQGKSGRIVGTDGKLALIWSGFRFPFPDNLLIPAVPVFSARPLARCVEAEIGQTVTHLVITAGPWSVWLPFDQKARYPDVASVIPRSAPTTAGIDERDAAELLKLLPGLPGADHELRPVTIEADRIIRVRGRGEDGPTSEITLIRSPAAGPGLCVVLDRRVLARALTLGCRTARLTPDKPVVLEGDGFVLVAAQLDPVLIAPPLTDETGKSSTEDSSPSVPPRPPSERRPQMKPESNGQPTPRDAPPDLLELAEELRSALAEAVTRATRLVSAVRQSRKDHKVISTVLSNLKQLNLGNGGPR